MRADALLAETPPQDREAERAMLGACFNDRGAIDRVLEYVKPEDIYGPAHAKVFEAMLDLHARGAPIEATSVVGTLRDRGQLDAIGGPSFVAALESSVTTSANATFYAERVAEKAQLARARVALARAIEHTSGSSTETVPERLERIEKLVFEATRARNERRAVSMSELLAETFRELEEAKAGRTPGVLAGINGLDELTHGLRPGDLAILAARPAMGKSTLALNLLRNVALPRGATGRPVALLSFEMPALEITKNLLCLLARVDSHRLRGRMTDAQEDQDLLDAAEHLERAPIEILGAGETAGFTVLDVRSHARRWKADRKLDLLIVDYLQLVRGSERRDRSREQEVASISRDLRALAAELNVPVLALAQLNRNVEDRTDRRPRLSDLRESGSIEADASLVLLLHREGYYMPLDRAQAEGLTTAAELLVAKNRYGPSGRSVPLYYDAKTGLFADGEAPARRATTNRRGRDAAAAAAGEERGQ